MILFLVWENWSKKTDFTAKTIFFCTFVFNLFWWMTLYYFGCISVIFRAINFVRYTYESLDFEDSKNMWFYPKSIHPAWVSAKIRKLVETPVLASSHRKIKKFGSKWKFMILKILFSNFSFFSDMIVFLVWENWSEKTDFTAQTIFFVPSFSIFFWSMTLDCSQAVCPLSSKLSTSFVWHWKT